jgi:hypothetical protein
LVTLLVLAIHPIPECIDCEFPRPWGRADLAYLHTSAILDVWFVVASITAGYCSARRYWLVPVSIVIAHVITQPLGGVALWSLWSNEAPLIVLLGFVAGVVCLSVGGIMRFLVDRFATATP